jgi:hypothetical protein
MHVTNPFLYPGKGKQLRGATSAGVPSDPEVLNIPNAGYSEPFHLGDGCVGITLLIKVNTGAATGDVVIHQGDDNVFTNVITHATITTNTFRVAKYVTDLPMVGGFRLLNSSGQTINVWFNQKIQ